jgi:glutamate synthase domain-containing protein 2/glutamate synthase domain-containing protein 1/glutamate synthase domain-containing protein 3
MKYQHLPPQQGLYDPRFEHDACGVGFVCNIKGKKTNKIIKDGLTVLRRMAHRGAVGSDPDTGDGAGLLIQAPHKFLLKIAEKEKIKLPETGQYGVGLVFLPTDKKEYKICKNKLEALIKEHGQSLLGWRKVPVDNSCIGKGAKETEPVIEHLFIQRNNKLKDPMDFERQLYIIRKRAENYVRNSNLKQKSYFYIPTLSYKLLAYKGLLMPHQVDNFFLDLKDKDIESALCLVHSRYSTNTFPTWDLAQPFRFLAHNGEINTVRGNINWMTARQGLLKSKMFGKSIKDIKPIIVPGGSDSATLDNALELLLLSGRSLEHVLMMLVPSAWENSKLMDQNLRDFYKYHACFMEPWDGPAALAVTDGVRIAAALDRNGLRPARYVVTKQDSIVMASEVGVLDIDPKDIAYSGRLEPGKMFFVDTEQKRIINDDELKQKISTAKPYSKWIKDNLVELESLKSVKSKQVKEEDVVTLQKSFGYSREDIRMILKPMAQTGKEPTHSMGNDAPHAVLSKNPQVLYNYFKQLFAQVTNPAVDPIREEVVMSWQSFVGPQKNIFDETPEHCHSLRVKNPLLTDENLAKIKHVNTKGFKSKTISLLFKVGDKKSFMQAIKSICDEAVDAIKKGYTFIILSDKGTNQNNSAIPALLATGAVHHHLVRKALRTQIGIIVESAEPREVHHFAVLFGYGADCINPYLVYKTLANLIKEKELDLSFKDAQKNYIKAVKKGILKITSKMGICTLQSYKGAQIFEAIGLSDEVMKRCFNGTPSRIGGANFEILRQETVLRHKHAYPDRQGESDELITGGVYQWKKDGEAHLWNPATITALQDSTRSGDWAKYQKFAKLINDQSDQPVTLRSLLKFKDQEPIPIEKVESDKKLVRRFVTGAMSFGSISKEIHEALAIVMNRLGGMSNTGEGGEDPARFVCLPNGDLKRSAIKQIASGRFGVTTNYLVNADEIQIKIAQGAKPGEGGQLPGHKVSSIIAKTRYTTPGVTLISPPPHHDIYSIEDLAQLIFDLKNVNPRARISVKLVSEIGVGTVAAGVAKGHADMILISGADGGTGASPMSSIRHAGLPWELGLAETHQTLVLNDLRSRVRLQTDGQMRTGRDVAIAAILGAEEFGFCTTALIVMGCVMLRHCHLNNCNLGIATQDEILRKRFRGRPEYLENFFYFVARELRQIMASLGVKSIDELVGRTDLLEVDSKIIPWKAKGIDFSKILYKPEVPKDIGVYCTQKQDHNISRVLDRKLIKLAKPALEHKKQITETVLIKNADRTTGAMLSGEVAKRYGEDGLYEDTINFKFIGEAGQSFGAWLIKGITFELEGLANDYVGKGMFGGKLIVYPGRQSTIVPDKNILIGNTTFYGAISGEAYIQGIAGERFCIRNSGLHAVVEGVGDHGCEYMTGGRVVILGKTGINFGAGMSGGIAYIYDEDGMFRQRVNMSMVELQEPGIDDKQMISNLIRNHCKYTQSKKAIKIFDDFATESKKFIKVMPLEYKRILSQKELEQKLGVEESV